MARKFIWSGHTGVGFYQEVPDVLKGWVSVMSPSYIPYFYENTQGHWDNNTIVSTNDGTSYDVWAIMDEIDWDTGNIKVPNVHNSFWDNYQPTKMRITYESEIPLERLNPSLWIYGNNELGWGSVQYAYTTNYQSGVELDLDYTDAWAESPNIGGFELYDVNIKELNKTSDFSSSVGIEYSNDIWTSTGSSPVRLYFDETWNGFVTGNIDIVSDSNITGVYYMTSSDVPIPYGQGISSGCYILIYFTDTLEISGIWGHAPNTNIPPVIITNVEVYIP